MDGYYFEWDGTANDMHVHSLCMKNYLLFNVISFADFFLIIFFFRLFIHSHDCRIVSVFICEAFYQIISFADGCPFELSSVTYASWASLLNDSDMKKLSLAFDLITIILVIRGWRGPLYSKLVKLNYGFASDNYYRHISNIQSLNKRKMNLTHESYPIRTEFQLRNNSLINDFEFIVFYFYVWWMVQH